MKKFIEFLRSLFSCEQKTMIMEEPVSESTDEVPAWTCKEDVEKMKENGVIVKDTPVKSKKKRGRPRKKKVTEK